MVWGFSSKLYHVIMGVNETGMAAVRGMPSYSGKPVDTDTRVRKEEYIWRMQLRAAPAQRQEAEYGSGGWIIML